MFPFIAQIARLIPAQAGSQDNGVAHQLMERAEATAGQDPHRAQELREAASAFLRVVR